MNARVVFTKDFLNKTKQKPLSRKQIGELRMKNLAEAEEDGRINEVRNRQ